MNGGPSHVDTFDPKPLLDKYHGKPLPNPNLRTERKTAGAMRSPFSFQRFGKSGIGRELGPSGLEEYQEKKHIYHNTSPAPAHWFSG